MIAVLSIAILLVLFWWFSVVRKDASVIDIAWGLGFVCIAWTSWGLSKKGIQSSFWSLLLLVMVTVWGCRLSIYLFLRNYGRPEDNRYQIMRHKWGASFWWISFFTVFALQGAIMWLVSLPLQFGVVGMKDQLPKSSYPWTSYLYAISGMVLWIIGMLFETLGDWQLAQFRSNPENQGRVLQTGLWRYSRHPNYFGDFLVWWGFYGMALSVHAPWWTILSPIVMSVLLMRVSGVPLLERALKQTKPGYQEYAMRTNAFFPWFPSNHATVKDKRH